MTATMMLMIVVYCVILCIASETMRRLPPRWGLAFWLIVPLALLPHFLNISASHGGWSWFLWVKIYSITLTLSWIMFCRMSTGKIPKLAVQVSLFIAIGLNIFEAVALDALLGNYGNAIAGILLILTMRPLRQFSIDNNKYRDFLHDPGVPWIIAYTLWDLVFIYYSFKGTVIVHHLAVLAAPLIISVFTGWERYLQSRGFTLGLHAIVYVSAFGWYREHFSLSPEAYVPDMQWIVQLVSLACVVCLLNCPNLLRTNQSSL